MTLDDAEKEYFTGYLKELKKVYFTGASRVKYRERDTTFRSLAEMKTLIDELEGALNPDNTVKSGASLAEFSTGL